MAVEPNKVIYSMIRVSKYYDKKPVLKDISLSYFYGAKIGVLGLNGSGKSSLLRILAGVDKEFNGETILSPGHTVGFLEQEPVLDETKTVKEIVEQGAQETVDLLNEFNRINEKFAEPMSDEEMDQLIERQGQVQEKLDALDAWDLDSRLDMAMEALRCPPGDTPVKILSGGERRRVALCRLLLQKPDILLLDEPTNHLDAESVAWLEHHLQRYRRHGHRRHPRPLFPGQRGRLDPGTGPGEGIPWKGNYSSWLEQKQNRLRTGRERGKQAAEDPGAGTGVDPHVPQGPPRQGQGPHQPPMSPCQPGTASSGKRTWRSISPRDPVWATWSSRRKIVTQSLRRPPAAGGRLLQHSPRRHRGRRSAPTGPVKPRSFRLITGQEQPNSGRPEIGETVKLAYVDQSRDVLDPEKTVWEMISGGQETIALGTREINSRGYVARFNFGGTDQQKKVGLLSGGERNRVHLARMLKEGANVLLLDEPTNDLDVNTMRALEEALENFAGCAMVISHDRWFLDRIATHLLIFEGESRVAWFDGNYQRIRRRPEKTRWGPPPISPTGSNTGS